MPATNTAATEPKHSALYISTARKLARLVERIKGDGSAADDALYVKVRPLRPIMAALHAAFTGNHGTTLRTVEEDMETTFSPELAEAVEIEITAAKCQRSILRKQYAMQQAAEAQQAADRTEWLRSLR